MTKPYLTVPPATLTEHETWRVLVHEAESGVEQRTAKWTFPRREWDLTWPMAYRPTETETIRELLHSTLGPGMSFYFREPNKTSRNNIFIGTGTGSRTSWVFPVQSYYNATVRVNSTTFSASSYDIYVNSANGATLSLLVFKAAVSSGSPVTVDYVTGHYVPIVRLVDEFAYTHHPWGYDFGSISFTVRETKEEYPTS